MYWHSNHGQLVSRICPTCCTALLEAKPLDRRLMRKMKIAQQCTWAHAKEDALRVPWKCREAVTPQAHHEEVNQADPHPCRVLF